MKDRVMVRVLLVLLRVLLTPVLVVLVMASSLACVGTDLAERHLLNADFYLDVLAENDAYARVIDEVLLETEEAEITDELVAHTSVSREELSDLVREILQVKWLQDQIEGNLRAFFAYLRGDADDLTLQLELQPVLDRMQPAISGYLRKHLGEIRTEPVASYAEFRDGLDRAMEMIRDGEPVVVLPTYALADAEMDDLLDSIFAPDSLLAGSTARPTVEAALRRQDTAAALMAVADELIAARLEKAVDDLSENLDENRRLDLVAEIADDQEESRAELLAEFEDARFGVELLTRFGRLVAAGLLVFFATLLGLIYLPSRLWSLLVPGATLAVAGAAGLVAWVVLAGNAPAWAGERILEADTELSTSALRLLAQIAEDLTRRAADSLLWPSLATLLLGTAAITAGVILQARTGRPTAGGQDSPGGREAAAAGATGTGQAAPSGGEEQDEEGRPATGGTGLGEEDEDPRQGEP